MAYLQIHHHGHHVTMHGVETVRAAADETWIRLPSGPLTFGRSPPRVSGAPHVQVQDMSVARCHGAITPCSDGYGLTDLESAGGTSVDTEAGPIWQRPGSPAYVLHDGDTIFFGAPAGGAAAVFRLALPTDEGDAR